MQKKLMAVAVAGALAAPAMALAQTSTVNIYGTVVLNYNLVDPGAVKPNVDMFNAHDTNIGVRGQEKLGGGLTAWFQCESTMDLTGEETSGNGLCTRNSGIGLRGNFGNVFWGQWDTPAKLIAGPARIWSTSGAFGNAEVLWNGSASNVGNGTRAAAQSLSSGSSALNAAGFSRRQMNMWNYHSPSWSGFELKAAFSAIDEATGVTNATVANKARLWSLGGSYTNGPLYLGLAYEQHKDYDPAQQGYGIGAYTGGTDRLWNIAAAYTFARVFKLTGIYTDIEYETAGGLDSRRKSWAIYGDWNISGPHRLRMGYAAAGDSKGTFGTFAAPRTISAMVANGGAGGTGADLFSIQYAYAFSKRTEINFGYSMLDNEDRARYALQTLVRPGTVGQRTDAIVLGVRHSF